jgi:D-lactate dehydrogenase
MNLEKGDATPPVIVFLEVEAWEEAILKRLCPPAWRARYYTEEADRIDLGEIVDAQIISVFIYSNLDAPLLSQLPSLRMIATRSTGYDHIDMAYCRERNIVVSNVPSYGANTVAEHTFALLLSLSRNIYQARERTLRNDFSFHGLQGFDLMGKILGVIGTGQIGRHVIRIAKGFEMQVLAYDPHQDTALCTQLGFEYVSLDALLACSDVISLHCPLTAETQHLIGKSAFMKMKKNVHLINTARGGLIDTEALLWALDAGIVAGAGLDVLEEEEAVREERELLSGRFDGAKLQAVLRNHVLAKCEQVIITPHIAFNSREAVERILQTTVENISAYLAAAPSNVVAAPSEGQHVAPGTIT